MGFLLCRMKGEFKMANETNGKSRGSRSQTAKEAKVTAVEITEEDRVVEESAVEEVRSTREEVKTFVPKTIDPDQYVTVRNGFQGKLIYISKRTGEKFEWEGFGDEQDMELSELKNARNAYKIFFINNWFMFDEAWIIDYLGMGQYYRNSIPINRFDEVFEKSPDEIEMMVSKMPEGQKHSLAYRAKQLIAEGGIDSNRVISSLEKCLGVELIEK